MKVRYIQKSRIFIFINGIRTIFEFYIKIIYVKDIPNYDDVILSF